MKNNTLFWIFFILFSLQSQNKASKLRDSLFCFVQYSPFTFRIICSWSENLISRQLVNISLIDLTGEFYCQEMENNTSQTHVYRTCDMASRKTPTWTHNLSLIFQPNKSLESRLNISGKADEAKPQNLSCNVDGKLITCICMIRMEIAESFDFSLFYDDENGSESECQLSCQTDIPYLSCRCTITVKDHLNTSAVLNTIRVGPAKPEKSLKVFSLCSNITLPPRNLTINETKKGEIFIVSGKNNLDNTYFKEYYRYELCYWGHNDLNLDKSPNNCPGQQKNLSNIHDPSVILRLGEQLEPNTNYTLKIRARLLNKRSSSCFNGPWSEWSQLKVLQTKAVPNTFFLYILIPTCVILLIICGLCGYRALLKYKNQWEDRIPNPSKSSIVKGFQKEKASKVQATIQPYINHYNEEDWLAMRYLNLQKGPSLPYEEHLYVEPYNKILCTSSVTNYSSNLKCGQECVSLPDHDLIVDAETQSFYSSDLNENHYPTASITEGYRPFSDLTDEQERTDTFAAFDGPYLFAEHG